MSEKQECIINFKIKNIFYMRTPECRLQRVIIIGNSYIIGDKTYTSEFDVNLMDEGYIILESIFKVFISLFHIRRHLLMTIERESQSPKKITRISGAKYFLSCHNLLKFICHNHPKIKKILHDDIIMTIEKWCVFNKS